MKSASEKLVVLNKKVEDFKAVKAENAQLKKELAAGGLQQVKKQKEALQEKVEELKLDNYKWEEYADDLEKKLEGKTKELKEEKSRSVILDEKLEKAAEVIDGWNEGEVRRQHQKEMKELTLKIEEQKAENSKAFAKNKVDAAEKIESLKTEEMKERKRHQERMVKKRGENEDMRKKKRGRVALDNLAYARENAMMGGGMGGGMSGGMGAGGGGAMCGMGTASNFPNPFNYQQQYASNMQNMFRSFMQMMGAAPNGNPFANMQRDFSQRETPFASASSTCQLSLSLDSHATGEGSMQSISSAAKMPASFEKN